MELNLDTVTLVALFHARATYSVSSIGGIIERYTSSSVFDGVVSKDNSARLNCGKGLFGVHD